jgi:hypothetical protein
MKRVLTLLAAFAACFSHHAAAEQYRDIKPEWRCHYPRKDRSFCKVFPNFSLRHRICNPEPALLGNKEWSRRDVTVTDRLQCGTYETYEAVVVTYRPVYENGALGEKFKRTYRKDADLVTPPVIAGQTGK